MKRIEYLKKAIASYCLKLDQKGFVANHDGNISVRLDEGFLATPTAEAKAAMTPEMVLLLDGDGKKIEGIGNPFSEMALHLAAYRTRSDAQTVIHAHPPIATARGLAGLELNPKLPEAIVSIGNVIPVVPHAMPGSAASVSAVEEALKTTDVLIIAGNGVLAIGDDLEQAYLRLELVEHLCKIEFYLTHMGGAFELPGEDVQKLVEKRKALGLGPQAREAAVNTSPTMPPKDQDTFPVVTDAVRHIIAEEIARALRCQ